VSEETSKLGHPGGSDRVVKGTGAVCAITSKHHEKVIAPRVTRLSIEHSADPHTQGLDGGFTPEPLHRALEGPRSRWYTQAY